MIKITCIHTVQTLIKTIDDLLKDQIGAVEVNHMYDDFIVKSITKNNGFKSEDYNRLLNLLKAAEETGCDYIFVTCSSLSSAVKRLEDLIATRIVRIDEPMIKKALKMANEITVVATAESTLGPTERMIQDNACKMGVAVETDLHLVAHALNALKDGNIEIHDQLVLDYVQSLKDKRLILLAQGSMAHLQKRLDNLVETPVLSSPKAAVEYINELIEEDKK